MDLQTSRPHMRQQGFLWMPTPGWCLYQVAAAAAKSRQLCPTLCDPTDCSPPGSPIPGRQEGKRVNLTFGGQQLQGFGFKLQMKPSTARSPPPTSALRLTHQSSSTLPCISQVPEAHVGPPAFISALYLECTLLFLGLYFLICKEG